MVILFHNIELATMKREKKEDFDFEIKLWYGKVKLHKNVQLHMT